MTPRQFLALAICVLLAGCDTSATVGTDDLQAGTSSETQTSLQALADSLATIKFIHLSSSLEAGLTSRKLAGNDSLPLANRTHYDDPIFQRPILFADYTRYFNSNSLIDSAFAYQTRYAPIETGSYGARQVQETRLATSMIYLHQWDVASTEDTTSLSGSGISRSGFAFSYRSIDSSEEASYQYPHRKIHDASRPRLYSFGQGWQVLVPGSFFDIAGDDTLPLYQGRTLVGWMISKGQLATRPIWDWSCYTVHDLEGRAYIARGLGAAAHWPFDSMGLFFTRLHEHGDSNVAASYSWNLFPGTTKAMQSSGVQCTVWGYWEGLAGPIDKSIARLRIPEFPTDSGHAELSIGKFVDGAIGARLVTNCSTTDSMSMLSFNSDHPRF